MPYADTRNLTQAAVVASERHNLVLSNKSEQEKNRESYVIFSYLQNRTFFI